MNSARAHLNASSSVPFALRSNCTKHHSRIRCGRSQDARGIRRPNYEQSSEYSQRDFKLGPSAGSLSNTRVASVYATEQTITVPIRRARAISPRL